MKTLLLLRHAKSSWKDASLADHDRPLKGRGIKAALKVGELLMRERGLQPDSVVCSTALRARETLQLVLQEASIKPLVDFSPGLYHCPPAEFGSVLRETKQDVGSLMLVGHNPGLEEFLADLVGRHEEFPTAALAQLELTLEDWTTFSAETSARLVNVWRPRDIEADE